MCRSCAEGGRRCPGETPEKRRARQNAAYHAKKHTTEPRTPQSGNDDATASAGLEPLEGPVTAEQVRERIEHAQQVLARADDTPLPDIEGAYRPGERMTNTNDEGWLVPTEYGLEAEAATRAAGAAVAARAEELAGPALEKVPQDKKVLEFVPDGAASREEYAAQVKARSEALYSEITQLRREAAGISDFSERFELQRQSNHMVPEVNKYLTEAALVEQGDSAWDRAEARAYSDAYRQVLAEQRDMGLPGGKMIEVGEDSQKATVARLKKALHYYPSDWLARESSHETSWETTGIMGPQSHKEQIPLVVRSTTGRAYYSDIAGKTQMVRGEVVRTYYSELTIDKKDGGCLGPGVSTALHEYGHRVERVQPRVNDLAQTHLARRTMNDDGERHELEPYLVSNARLRSGPSRDMWSYERNDAGKSEWVRSDDFAERYMGKQNSSKETSSEVFTTGMEGVFAGRFGGLRGTGRWKEDREHRDFILGTLATVK